MAVHSPRLTLRPFEIGDISEAYVGWLNDPEVVRFLETRYAKQDMKTVREYVSTMIGRANEYFYGIFLRQTQRHIGNIKVGPVSRVHALGDISLVIGARDCWGQGYATEAIRAMSLHAFEDLGVRKLSAGMYAPNVASMRAFERAGFTQEGIRREHYLLEGEPCDVIQLALLRKEVLPEKTG